MKQFLFNCFIFLSLTITHLNSYGQSYYNIASTIGLSINSIYRNANWIDINNDNKLDLYTETSIGASQNSFTLMLEMIVSTK